MNQKFVGFLFLVLFSPSVFADMFGATDTAQINMLSKMYYETKKLYGAAMKQLKTMKAQHDTLDRMKDMYKEARKEQAFIENLDLERELQNVRSDIGGLTLLDDDHSGKTALEKLDILAREIDRRIEDAKTPAEREYLNEQRNRLEQLKRLEKLREQKLSESENIVTTNPTEKTIAASNASSNALIAALKAAERQRQLEREITRAKTASENRQAVGAMSEAFEKIGKRKQ